MVLVDGLERKGDDDDLMNCIFVPVFESMYYTMHNTHTTYNITTTTINSNQQTTTDQRNNNRQQSRTKNPINPSQPKKLNNP